MTRVLLEFEVSTFKDNDKNRHHHQVATWILSKFKIFNDNARGFTKNGQYQVVITKLLLTYCPNADTSGISPQERISFRRIHPSSKMLLQIVRKKRPDKIFSSEYCAVWIFSVTALILWSSAVWQIVSESNDWFSNNTDWPTEGGICWLLYLVEIMKVHFPYFEVELDFH